jgi:hypothetical protein
LDGVHDRRTVEVGSRACDQQAESVTVLHDLPLARRDTIEDVVEQVRVERNRPAAWRRAQDDVLPPARMASRSGNDRPLAHFSDESRTLSLISSRISG